MITRDLIGSEKQISQVRKASFNLDTILLQAFVKIPKNAKHVVDIGTGNGALLLYLSEKTNAKLTGIEIVDALCIQAKDNLKLNNLEKQVSIICKDLNVVEDIKDIDVIVSNPPFFKVNEKRLNEDYQRRVQRHEVALNMAQLFSKAQKMLKETGIIYLVHRPNRLSEILEEALKNRFEVKEIKFVYPYQDQEANHVLLKFVKNASKGVKIHAPLILYKEKGVMSDALIDLYEKGVL